MSMTSKLSEPMNNKAFGRCGWIYQSALFAILLAIPVIQTQAQVTDLSVGSTSLQVSLGGATPGLSDWMVDGVNQLGSQWFYYSIGSGAVNSIDTISAWTTPTVVNTASSSYLTETYANSNVKATALIELEGSSSAAGQASLVTTLTLQNLSSSAQTLYLYQFSAFNLANLLGNQTVQFSGIGAPYKVTQTVLGGGVLSGTVNVGPATVTEAAGVQNGGQLGLLNGNGNPGYNDTSLSAAGSVDYAYEISQTLNPNFSITISEIQTVPEPSIMALTMFGTLASGLFYWRKLASRKKVVNKASL
jgi:hypothetical protein